MQPNDTNEQAVATQLAMRSRKSESLHVIDSLGGGIFTVRASEGNNAYTIDLAKLTCTCPDFVFRMSRIEGGKCKHILRVENQSLHELARLERESQEALWRQYA